MKSTRNTLLFSAALATVLGMAAGCSSSSSPGATGDDGGNDGSAGSSGASSSSSGSGSSSSSSSGSGSSSGATSSSSSGGADASSSSSSGGADASSSSSSGGADASSSSSSGGDAAADSGCSGTELTVYNISTWCTFTINGGAGQAGLSDKVCVATSSTVDLSAFAHSGFELGPTPWHDTSGDHGSGDPGTFSDAGANVTSSTTLVATGATQCAWVCCPFMSDGSGCDPASVNPCQ